MFLVSICLCVFQAKIACTGMCKCVGCRNVEEGLGRGPRRDALLPAVRGPRRDAALHSLQYVPGAMWGLRDDKLYFWTFFYLEI